ncbi:hypothetical protein SR914_19455 [Comamonas testosteroni]|uniref:hypothetical protein n=1 Tax=Comamonas TaxID=283 RepID=UPI0000E7BDB7|nr:hypothetical protein [Comamonas testosteroni]WQG65349.1 hypothetical protein SR914_19455 [Comamonas testosteroni]
MNIKSNSDIRSYQINTKKFNALAAKLAVTRPDIGHPDVVERILKKARDAGAAGLLITPIADGGLAVRAAECPDHIPAALISLPGGPSLLLSTDSDATDATDLLMYLQMLSAKLPVPPFYIVSAAMSAVAAIRIDTGMSALSYVQRWGAQQNPAVAGQRPEDVWHTPANHAALTYLVRLSVAARSATAANDRFWRKSA